MIEPTTERPFLARAVAVFTLTIAALFLLIHCTTNQTPPVAQTPAPPTAATLAAATSTALPSTAPPKPPVVATAPVATAPLTAVVALTKPANTHPDFNFFIGADISSVQAAEARNAHYTDGGVQKDLLQILKDHGFNYIRLRIFNDPTKAAPATNGGRGQPAYSAQGFCDLPHTIAMAKRVKAAGMGLLIDFHYSDSWADPGKQFAPAAWRNLNHADLVKALHDWTKDAITQMKTAGGLPDMVQVGNEITPGMMNDIPAGGSTRNWKQLGDLLKAGLTAVKEVDPQILTMLHIDKGGNNQVTRQWVDAALAQGVDFDVLGESCYTQWQGQPATWKANFDDLIKRYPKLKFTMAELAANVKEGNDIMQSLPDHRGLGTFIWEPTQNGNQQQLFDRTGAVVPARMSLYDQVLKDYSLPKLK